MATEFSASEMARLVDGLERAVGRASDGIRDLIASRSIRVGHKPGEGPVTEADHLADDILHEDLMALLEDAHWLSEESYQSHPIVRGEPTWVVDPLDGTREFVRGLPEFGVSVGLFLGDELCLGAVGLPAGQSVLSGARIDGQWQGRVDGEPLHALDQGGDVNRVVVSRFDFERRRVQYHIPFDTYPCGSAAVKLVRAAVGDGEVYFSTGPRSIWDIAGGTAVLLGAGGQVLDVRGRPLEFSPTNIGVPPYVAGAPESCRTLLRALDL